MKCGFGRVSGSGKVVVAAGMFSVLLLFYIQLTGSQRVLRHEKL
jgi:hypothetical protein